MGRGERGDYRREERRRKKKDNAGGKDSKKEKKRGCKECALNPCLVE